MDKSPDAFRTISEVATLLETPAHVLRFWETRFPQIRPVKRAGGRRYYRPNDIALLTGIKYLLHAEGMTIRGVQKVLRDHGVRHVAGLIGVEISDIEFDAEAALGAALSANFGIVAVPAPTPARADGATIVALETALWRGENGRKSAQSAAIASVQPIDFKRTFDDTLDGETPSFPGFEPPDLTPPHLPAVDLTPANLAQIDLNAQTAATKAPERAHAIFLSPPEMARQLLALQHTHLAPTFIAPAAVLLSRARALHAQLVNAHRKTQA